MSTVAERGHKIIEVDSGYGYKIRVCEFCNVLEERIVIEQLLCIPEARRRQIAKDKGKRYFCEGEDCGIELTALNMSDDEKYCQTCFDKIVAGIDTNDESTETKWMPEGVMDDIIQDKYPQAYTSLPHVQRIRRFKGY